MEDFWQNICVPSFHHQSSSTRYASRAIILRDFRPTRLSDEPLPSVSVPRSPSLSYSETPVSSFLSLSSGSGFQPKDSFESNPKSRAKKRSRETGDGSMDQKYKRLMKNRESAARSRARKHAYTYKLELEVARLQEENAELRRQQEKMSVFATPKLPQEKNLHRTLTAPF